ncbi:heavy metal translocating P-type ATPase [Verrucomicrobiota bacterium sgz303538]
MSNEHNHCCSHCHEGESNTDQAVLNIDVSANRTTVLAITGMDCGDEVAALQKVLKPIAGVREVQANLMASKVTIHHDDRVGTEQLINAISPTGMTARAAGREKPSHIAAPGQRWRVRTVAASGICTAVGLVLHWTHVEPALLQNVVFGAAIVSGGWFIFPKAIAALRSVRPDMNLLMTVAVIGAVAIGEWSEAAAVTFLFGLSELLEALSVQRARRAIESLLELSPDTALLKTADGFKEVPVEEVELGATIGIRSGARIPLDGVVIEGTSAVNQAPITGESVPVEKKAGDSVFAGSINGRGSLDVQVTKLFNDTTLARIIHLVEEAQSQKAPSQRFVDVFSKYYTPAVMVLALVVFVVPPLVGAGSWLTWLYRALVLLVIACPCALVIATPVAIVSGLTAMARRGVLVKGGAFMEAVGKLRALAVDKTGTITEGRPRVTRVMRVRARNEADVLRVAAAIDSHSNHPLSEAVVAFAKEQGVPFPRATDYQSHTGRGAEGSVDGHLYFVGNHRFAHELGVCSEQLEQELAAIESEALSVVVVGHKPHADCKGEVLGVLAVGDTVRPNASAAIKSLHEAGVKKVVMLSGDNQRTVDAIARQAGIDEAQGDLLPDQKIERVHLMLREYGAVGMVGDGVNDAPAMAAATIGIAMGGAGTDTAIETADLTLMQDDLSNVSEAIILGRRTLRLIQFNITFALVIKAVFLVLTLLGHASLWLAIAADTGATLLVIANSLRLLQQGDENEQVRGEGRDEIKPLEEWSPGAR